MAVYFAVGTPIDDGRIQDFKLIPPPGTADGQVLLWDNATQEPRWMSLAQVIADLGISTGGGGSIYAPLADSDGGWLLTDTGARLVVLAN